ncbi:hypothetical protein [Alicyclobacillus fastidiosus]|uniref:Protein glutaminase domain-containing protein n=1 Tax=Alicyclobacillus fastidiosus TaxID=392011 RepID=A0ABV5AKI9_9BACL|nr:hypothetical protein [Alicyclobacillus fastidiosus]WEH09260.1 hypothetical protein PYS47_21725 [Alicyclobacillus fastidiosus]
MLICESGDILLYETPPNLDTRLILKGERMEDPGGARYFYHVAIALDANWKIEAQGKTVAITDIDYGRFAVFRPPIPPSRVKNGVAAVRDCVGQNYDWLAIMNDGLSYLTRGRIHLPKRWVESSERKRKICSSLVALYFNAAKWGPKFGLTVSPEDIYEAVKDWPAVG